ncbi:MAG: dihydroorotase [Candidatus Altiarchaeales archaeon]|nr:MAG: dihydroorotase [Candidatus Altiarchaeales archaeon]
MIGNKKEGKMADLVVKNARILLPDRIFDGGVVVENGRISGIKCNTDLPDADEIIDANGNYLLPGLIDCHVHFREPGASSKEDWFTGSCAAVAGGITTVLDMPNTQPPTITMDRLEEKRKIVMDKALVDYGFHFGATLDNKNDLMKLNRVASVKFYMSRTTGNLQVDSEAIIFEDFKILSEKKIPATVHAENNDMVEYWLNKLKDKKDADAMDYAEFRSNICAANAVNTVLFLSRIAKNRLHICHVSTVEELELIRKNKTSNITVEVTPHHLFLTKNDIKRLGNYSKVNPPLRSERDREALWNAIEEGLIDVIATDHAPHLKKSKERDILTASAGLPGIETMLPLLLNEVNKGRLSIFKLIRLTSENPARIFRIKNKGKIEIGYDADFVIVDMDIEKKVRNEDLFTKCKWSPFDGWKLKGWPVKTFIRGNLVFDEGSIEKIHGTEVAYMEDGS